LVVADFPSISWQEDWQVQVPNLWLSQVLELIVIWDWVLLSNDTFTLDNEQFVELIWIIELDLELTY